MCSGQSILRLWFLVTYEDFCLINFKRLIKEGLVRKQLLVFCGCELNVLINILINYVIISMTSFHFFQHIE